MKPEFSRHIYEKYAMPNFIKIRPVGAELFHADEQTDMTKPLVVFRSFTNAPQNCPIQISWEVKTPPSHREVNPTYRQSVRTSRMLCTSLSLHFRPQHSTNTESQAIQYCAQKYFNKPTSHCVQRLHIITECWVRDSKADHSVVSTADILHTLRILAKFNSSNWVIYSFKYLVTSH
jgi:hypothetical protein